MWSWWHDRGVFLELVELGSILKLEKGRKPVRQDCRCGDGFAPYVDIEAFETGNIRRYTDGEKCVPCEEGDILIVCDGSRSGLAGYAVKGYVGSTLAKISAEGLSGPYLFHFLQGKYSLLNTRKRGTGTPHLDVEMLRGLRLRVPAPSEQERTVTRLEGQLAQLNAAETRLKAVKEHLRAYRQAVLKEAFSKMERACTVREAASLVTSGSRGWARYYSEAGAKFIRIGNLTRDSIRINLEHVQHVSLKSGVEGSRTRLLPGDVLVSITADLGSIGYVGEDMGEAYINQHIALVRFRNPSQGKVMAWYFRSDFGQADLLKNKRGAGKLGLGLEDIRGVKVPFVSEAEGSRILERIEQRFSACEQMERTIETALRQSEALRQSILKKAFEGD